jgi:hypothetical protein
MPEAIKERTATVVSTGRGERQTIRQNIWSVLHPSIRAASSNSTGNSLEELAH